jgi:myo-inositol catabolism protein IolC
VVLGRGADDSEVEHWLRTAAGVPGYAGFAVGRTIWWDGVKAWKEGTLTRAQAAAAIGTAYRKCINAYEGAGR